MLLMALPNEHLMTFNQYKDAKTLFAAIQTRFGGNDATKKTQKTLLKQMYENFSTQSTYEPNVSQLAHEDLVQIYEDDLEEMDLKWQLALLCMWKRRFFQKTSRKITINRNDTAGYNKSKSYMADDEVPTNMALMVFLDFEVHNDKTCSKICSKRFEILKTQLDDLRIEFNKSEFNLASYKRGLASIEEQLVFCKKNEVIFCEQIAVLKRDISYKNSEISMLKSGLEKLKQEKESNQLKIKKFNNASKSLDKLIGSQIPNNRRKGVGFVSYNAVPPSPIMLFSPSKLELSNSGLEEFQQPKFEGYGPKTSNSANEDISNEAKESLDAALVKELVSDDKLEKKPVFPTVAIKEFNRHKQQEKPIRELVNLFCLWKFRPCAGSLQLPSKGKGVLKTATASTLDNGEMEITATIDGKVKVVTEASIRRHFMLEDYDGSTVPVESHHTPTGAPSTLRPHLSPTPRSSIRQETKISQSSSPPYFNLADEAASTGVDVRHGRAATTVKKLEKTVKTSQARRRAKIVVYDAEEDLEDPSKHGRKIDEIDQDPDISLIQNLDFDVAKETLVYIRRSAATNKGKGIMTESEPVQIKTKLHKEEQAMTQAQQRTYMSIYIKHMESHTLQQLRGYSFDVLKPLFETTMRRVKIYVPIESEVDRAVPEFAAGSSKRGVKEELDQGSSKRQKTGESSELAEEPRDKDANELSQEELQQMMIIVPEEGMHIEALQSNIQ
nr:ribonuclease H-like domain-containing protein [Tanacetum cinerariifolium]